MAKKLQVLRNATLFDNRALAENGLKTQLASLSDGELCLARYKDDGNVVTIMGVASDKAAIGKSGYTIFDTNSIPADVQAELEALDGRLDIIEGADNVAGSVAKALKDAKSYTDSEIQKLDSSASADANKFLTSVTITDGKISAKTDAAYASSDKTVTVNGLDLAVNIDGETIVKDNTSGVLSVASAALTQYVGENAVEIDATANAQNKKVVKLNIASSDSILTQDTNGLIANISVVADTTLAANEKEAYKIVGKNNAQLGRIPVYKDSSLHNVKLGKTTATVNETTGVITDGATTDPDALVFVYYTTEGKYTIANVPVADFLRESEFKNGLQVNNGEVSVKLDNTTDSDSAKFLTLVGTTEGQKAIGLQGISAAIAKATTVVSGESATNGPAVKVTTKTPAAADGHVEYVVAGQDLASATLLGAATDNSSKTTAFGKIEKAKEDLIGANTDAATANTINGAKNYADGKIDALSGSASGSNKGVEVGVTTSKGEVSGVTVTVDGNFVKSLIVNSQSASISNNAATVTIGGADIAVTSYNKSGKTGAIAATDTVNDALAKLENKADGGLDSVAEGNGISVTAKNSKSQTISVRLQPTKTVGSGESAVTYNNALEFVSDGATPVAHNGLFLSEVWDCGTY